MRTILVTGSDTGIGKTWVVGAIGRLLWQAGSSVQFVKAVETGRDPGEAGDADAAKAFSGIESAKVFRLALFSLPLAPLAAARAEAATLSFDSLLESIRKLPPADIRIIEGAGGIAVPLNEDGRDWRDFASAIRADRVVLVTPDRLGAINQARLTHAYAQAANLPCGIWLNEASPETAEIRQSNLEGLSGLPVWGTQRFEANLPENPEQTALFLSR